MTVEVEARQEPFSFLKSAGVVLDLVYSATSKA